MYCKIILRFTYRNQLNELHDYHDEFESVHDFRKYFQCEPLRAMAIDYIPAEENKLKDSRSSNVRLSIKVDNQEIPFSNAHDFEYYLKKNAEVASVLQFQQPLTMSASLRDR